ncbi:unnamed protein product [Ectocarpus sp. 4 AP-2014]
MAAPAAAAATAAATSATPKHPSPDAVTSAATGASSEAPSSVARNDVSTGAASPEVAAALGTTVASLPSGARENSVGLNAKAAGRSSSNNDNDNSSSSSSSSSKNNSTAASTGARNEGSTGEEIAGRGDVPSEIPGTTSRKHGGEQRQEEAREQHISEQPVDYSNKRQLHHRRLVPRNRGGGSVPPEVGRQIRLRQQERPRQRQHQQHQDHHDRQQNCQQPLRLGPQQQQQHQDTKSLPLGDPQHATKGPIGPRQASGEQLSAQQPMVASLLHQERQQRRLREWQWQQQRDLQQKQYGQQQQLLQLQKQQLETLQSLQQQHQRRQQQQHKQQQQQQRRCREEHNTNLSVQPSGAASGARSGHAPPMADVVDLSATLSPSTRQPPPEASMPSRMLSPLQLGGAPNNMFPRSGSGSDSDSIDGISSDSSGSGSSGEASSSPLHLQEQLGRALNALRNVHIQAWYEANGSRQTIHSLERKLEAAKSEVSRVKATMHVDYDVTAAAAAAPPSLDAPPPGRDHRRHPEREAVAAVASAPESTPKMPPDVAMDLGATAAVRTERTSAGRTFPRDVGKQEARAETSGGGAFSAPYSSDEKEGGAVSTRGTTAPPVVTASSPAVQPRRQYFSLRSDAAAAAADDDDGSAATAGAGAGPVAKNPLRESLRREKRRQRKQHKDYNSSRENEFKALDSPQTAAVTSADSAPSSKGPSKSRSNSLPSEADAVAASTAGTVAGNDGKHKRRRESQLPPCSLFSPPSSARGGGGGGSGGGGNGGGDERRGYRAGLETMAVESTEPAEAGEGHQIHYQRDDDAAVLEREVKRAKKSMEAEHAVLLADRDTTISQLSGEVTKRTDENALLLVALDSAVKEMASRLSSKDMEIQDARSELESAKHHFHRQYQQHQQQQQRQRQQHQHQEQQLQQQRQHLQPQQQQRQHQQQQGQVVRGVVGDKSARSGSVAGGPASVRTSPAPCDASAQASAWAPMTARGRRGTGSGPRRDVLQLNITLARQRQQQLQHLKALQQR